MVDLERVGKGLIAMGAVLADLKVIYNAETGDLLFEAMGEIEEPEIEEAEEEIEEEVEEPKKVAKKKTTKKKTTKKKTTKKKTAKKTAPKEEPKEEFEPETFEDEEEAEVEHFEGAVDEGMLRTEMVKYAKKTDKEKAFGLLAMYDGATAIAQLDAEQRNECYNKLLKLLA